MRTATANDVPALVHVINQAYLAEAFCINGDRTGPEEVLELLETGLFLAETDGSGQVLGSVFLRREGALRWYLGLLAVTPACQGRGLGRRLVAAAEDHCRERGGKFLDLTVVSARRELFDFYGRLGFAPNEVLPFRVPEKLRIPCHLVKFTK